MRRNYRAVIAGGAIMACLAGCRGGIGEIQAFKESENRETENVEAESTESENTLVRIPMVMIDGVMYYDAGRESTVSGRCGVMDGEITSAVAGTEVPAADDQSNFGSGYGYQWGPEEGTVEIDVDGRWMVFEQRDGESGQAYFEGQWYNTANLSDETLEWLVMYNRLPEEDQLALNHIPLELRELSGMAEEDGRTQETDAFRSLTELNDTETPDEKEEAHVMAEDGEGCYALYRLIAATIPHEVELGSITVLNEKGEKMLGLDSESAGGKYFSELPTGTYYVAVEIDRRGDYIEARDEYTYSVEQYAFCLEK